MRTFLRVIAPFCAIFLLLFASAAAGDPPEPFRIVELDDRPALHDELRSQAARARQVIRARTDRDWEGTLLIVWADAELYREKTGFQPEHTAAAASPSTMTIWINGAAWARATPAERQATMTHECGHILLGSLAGGRELPLWANEGIVMHLAGQWSYDDHLGLLVSHMLGRLPRLSDLSTEFPRTPHAQALSYRMSYAAVGVVASNFGDRPGDIRRLVHQLSDPVRGPDLARDFWDAYRVEGWQAATEFSLGSRVSSAVIVSSGTGTILLLAAILFIVAYLRVRARRAERMSRYDEEREPWEESLTEADVEDIYGDKEERWKSD